MKKNKVHHEHDVGYKHIFSHKGTFLELLRSFTKKECKRQRNNDYKGNIAFC